MDHRSQQEKVLHDKIKTALHQLSVPHQSRNDYALLMGTLRDMRTYLDNRESGCANGLHACDCLCDHGVQKTIRTIKKEGAKPHAPYLS